MGTTLRNHSKGRLNEGISLEREDPDFLGRVDRLDREISSAASNIE
jgi:hypothetical protein